MKNNEVYNFEKHSKKERCRYFQTCSAALCPLDENVKRHRWYPDPDIELCKLKDIPWVKTQRKIIKAGSSPHYYFTLEMLGSINRVSRGIQGVNDQQKYGTAFNEWMLGRQNRHVGSRPLKNRCDKPGVNDVYINPEPIEKAI